jgi:4-amino-4-deoxy-L-arabinose transferase-like glycosyltransferase
MQLNAGHGISLARLKKRRTKAALVLVFITALFLRIHYINCVGFFYDTALLSRGTLKMIGEAGYLNARGYYLTDHPTTRSYPVGPLIFYLLTPPHLMSANPLLTASYMALLNTAAVVLYYLLAKRLFGQRVGLLAGMLYAVSPLSVLFSRMAYNYSFMQLFTVIYLFSLMRVSVEGKSRYIASLLVSMTALIELGQLCFTLSPAAVIVLAVFRPKLNVRYLVLGVILSLIVLVPHLYWDFEHDFHDIKNLFDYGRSNAGTLQSKVTGERFIEYVERQLSMGAAGQMQYQLGYAVYDFYERVDDSVKRGLEAEYYLLLVSMVYVCIYAAVFAARNIRCMLSNLCDIKGRCGLAESDVCTLVAVLFVLSLTLGFMLAATPDNKLLLPRYYVLFLPALYLAAAVFASDIFSLLQVRLGGVGGFVAEKGLPLIRALFLMLMSYILLSNIQFIISYRMFLHEYDYPYGWLTSEPGLPYLFNAAAVEFMRYDSTSRGCSTFTFSEALGQSGRTCSLPALEYTAEDVYNLPVRDPQPRGNFHYFVFAGRPPLGLGGRYNQSIGPFTIYPQNAVFPNRVGACS